MDRLFHLGRFDLMYFTTFLFEHPREAEGYSYLHELVRSNHALNAYIYVFICLNLIISHDINPNLFTNKLQQLNGMGYSLLYQAVNSCSLEMAELFLNIFHLLLPNIFEKKLHAQGPFRLNAKKDKLYRQEINELLSELRTQPKPEIIFYTKGNRKQSNFLSNLITLLHHVKRMDKKVTFAGSQYTLFPTDKPPIWDGLSPEVKPMHTPR